MVVEDWPKVPNLSLHSLECRLWHMHVLQKHRCEFAKKQHSVGENVTDTSHDYFHLRASLKTVRYARE